MRIIGGQFKGSVLAVFDGENVRPTSDRAREALFNILFLKTRGARVLDLFSGSGALGLESLSRGAGEVVFNDLSKDSVAILKKNLAKLKIDCKERGVTVMQKDYLACLNALSGAFDIIFIDPPYRFDYGVKALETIVSRKLLKDDGVVVYERDRAFEENVVGLEKYDERKYGKAVMSFFRKA